MNIPFKLLILDVDGVLTDGGMYYSESGDEFKKFNTKDGIAIRALSKHIPIGIISNGINKNLIQRRADLLGIEYVYVGADKKIDILNGWCYRLQIKLTDVAYIGDDVNDMECMKSVGISACPADAVAKIKAISKIQLSKNGGDACVREFIETYLDI